MRHYSSAYNNKIIKSSYKSINSEVVGYSWKNSRTGQETHIDLSGETPERNDLIIYLELSSAAENHRYATFNTIHEDGSVCEVSFVSGDTPHPPRILKMEKMK